MAVSNLRTHLGSGIKMISEHFSRGYLDVTADIMDDFESDGFYFYSVNEEYGFFNIQSKLSFQ